MNQAQNVTVNQVEEIKIEAAQITEPTTLRFTELAVVAGGTAVIW
jgi:hypothetical protein